MKSEIQTTRLKSKVCGIMVLYQSPICFSGSLNYFGSISV
jgi:hypothetical protein